MENLPGRIETSPVDSLCGYAAEGIGSRLYVVEPKHPADSSFYIAAVVQYPSVQLAESPCNEAHRRRSIAHPGARHRRSGGYAQSIRSG